MQIWVIEDATRVTGKIEYDEFSNKLVGFVLPLENGYPQINTYLAIDSFTSGVKANYAYVIMAQSLSDVALSFCLSIFGSY